MPKTLLTFLIFLALVLLFVVYEITISKSPEKPVADRNLTAGKPEKTVAEPKKPVESVAKKKQRFLDAIVPAVEEAQKRLQKTYDAVKAYENNERSARSKADIERLLKSYRVAGIPCLLSRLRTNPTSLVVAQAALETGWGTSRFYKEANNVFGIWSFNPDEPRMAASKTRDGKVIYVKKYPTLEASIEGYFKMIALGGPYEGLRRTRLKTDDPYLLITQLKHYSELRDTYVARLYAVIKSNDLTRFDRHHYKAPPLGVLLPEYVAAKNGSKAKGKADLLALEELKKCEENASVEPCETNASMETNRSTPAPVTEPKVSETNTSVLSADTNHSNEANLTKDPTPSPATAAPAHSVLP